MYVSGAAASASHAQCLSPLSIQKCFLAGTGGGGQLSHEYTPEMVDDYFGQRPVAVMRRSAQVAAEATGFGVAILLDLWTGNLKVRGGGGAEAVC